MKKIISYFIKYHVAVNIIILAVVIFGYLGTKSMKSSFFPLTESQFINISVVYPGASPQEMEEGVVLKIEDNFIKMANKYFFVVLLVFVALYTLGPMLLSISW